MRPITPRRQIFIRFSFTFALMFTFGLSAFAQQDVSQYDRGTPPQHAAGVSSFGSYISTSLGVVNLSNGALSINFPLGQVGGRGFWAPISLNYGSKLWSAIKGIEINPWPPPGHSESMVFAVYDDPGNALDLYARVAPGWTIGGAPALKARGVGIVASANPSCGGTHFFRMLVKLTLVLPDKGEIQLRDDQTDGLPLPSQLNSHGCKTMDGYRGRRWHATDGSGIIFIGDNDNDVVRGELAGTVILPNGTRYRFDHHLPSPQESAYINSLARASSITDRNGNKVTITYPTTNKAVFTDQLGRQAWWEFNATIGGTQWALVVRLPGGNGQEVFYKVKTAPMNQNYRSDINPILPVVNGVYDPLGLGYTPAGPHTSLFPFSYGKGAERIDDKMVVTELVLPDNRSLRFRYNEFGEVAEVETPTGGRLQYDYAYIKTLPSGNSLPGEVTAFGAGFVDPDPFPIPYPGLGRTKVQDIDRAVTTCRVYPDGSTHETTWTYVYNAATVEGVTTGNTEVQARRVAGDVLLSRQKHYFLGARRYLSPSGGDYVGTGYSLWSTGLERRSETLTDTGAVLNATEQDWSQRTPVVWSGYAQEQPENDNRINQRRNYLDTGAFAKTEIFYDNINNARANNVEETKEYDFDQTLKRRAVTSYLTTNPDNDSRDYSSDDVFLLSLPTRQSVYEGDEGDIEKARTVYQYDKYVDDGDNAELTDYGPSVTGRDAAYGPGKTTRGNVTAVGRWLDTNGSTLFTYSRYDTLGNVVSTKDPRGNVITISYADNFGPGDNPESGAGGAFGPTFALPTLIISPPPNPGGQQHTAKSQYEFSSGLLTGFKDRNGVITKTEYNDPFNRPTRIIAAKGVTGVETQTAMYYAPQATPYGVTLERNDALTAKDRDVSGDGILRSWTVTDGFGRTIESWTGHPQGDVKATTIYDALGRVSQTSNPHHNGEMPVYTTTAYDLAGRVTAVTSPDNAVVNTTYNGNQVTVTDQAGKSRRSETDALGRLIKVTEDPGGLKYETSYFYDALGNLRQVKQGAQNRTFVYDSLSRLTSATNPESGTMTYAYDPNGNLIEKTDARGVRTTMTYDALNRARSKVYTGLTPEGTNAANLTPPVNYFYDVYSALPNGAPAWPGTPSKGRLTGVTYGTGSEGTYYKYDAAGRIATNHQRQGTSNYATTYTYDRAGAVTLEARGNPVRRRILTTYDAAGRSSGMQTTAYPFTSVNTLVSNISYTQFGGLQSETYGNGLIHSMGYNNRLQPSEIRLGRLDNLESVFTIYYIYGTAHNVNDQDPEITPAHNNGNVARTRYSVNGTIQYTQTFQYDQLNRLRYAVEHNNGAYNDGARAWYQTFDYDRYGNRGINVANTSANVGATNSALQFADFSETNNRITRADYVYDAAGNLIAEPGKSYTYDAENRIVRADLAGGVTSQYIYDGNSHRMKKIVGGVATRFEYGAGGELITERNDSNSNVIKDYFYNGGALLATSKVGNSGEYEYATADHLGSPRAWTGPDGNLIAGGRHDYAPFGEELGVGVGIRSASLNYGDDSTRQKFDGYERDPETDLDFAQARYYSSLQGRFISPDSPFADQFENDPQSWNLYAFVRNNPCANTDPSGRQTCYYSNGGLIGCEGDKRINVDANAGTLTLTQKGHAPIVYDLNNVDAQFITRSGAPTGADYSAGISMSAPGLKTTVEGAGIVAAAIVAAPVIGPVNAAFIAHDLINDDTSGQYAAGGVVISPLANDWAQKGAHVKASNGVELAIRPGMNGEITLKPVFSSTSEAEANAAIKEVREKIARDPAFRQKLANTVGRGVEYLGKGSAMAKSRSGELRFLLKALLKMK